MILMSAEEFKFSLPSLPEIWYNFTIVADRWAAVIIVGSILIGFIIAELFRKTRDIQQWAIKTLAIKIPIFVFLLVYAYSYIYRFLVLM